MCRNQQPMFYGRWRLLVVGVASVATLIATADGVSPAMVKAADGGQAAPQRRLREVAPWLPSQYLSLGEVIAFEEHAHFVYLAGRPSAHQEPSGVAHGAGPRTRVIFLRPATLVVDVWPFEAEHRDIGNPTAISTVEVALGSGKRSRRAVCVYRSPVQATTKTTESIRMEDRTCRVAITESDRTFRLELPLDLVEAARISLESSDGLAILPKRHLPAGVMPYGPDGIQLIERWDSRYRGDLRPEWDKGFPSTHLKAAVESGAMKPGRVLELGCGTGTNAVYLAKAGFDVTAIDIAPTALRLAEEKAEQAGVKVRWLLADVLAPPADLETFDFIFDRGCYHGVRRNDAMGYVKAMKQLSTTGTHVFILAGNANEERHYGPPRVKEEELRGDFSSDFDFVQLKTVRFDAVDPQEQGALAWSVMLRRKAGKKP